MVVYGSNQEIDGWDLTLFSGNGENTVLLWLSQECFRVLILKCNF